MAPLSSPPSEHPRLGGEAVVLVVLLLVLAARAGWGAHSVPLEIVPPSPEILAAGGDGAPMRPEPGKVLVCGRFDDPGFYVDDLSRVAVVWPDGRQVPLTIDSGSIFVEFDQIVSLRFCFPLDEAEADAAEGLALQWGPDVQADNVQVSALAFDGARPDLYRTFRRREEATPAGADARVASIEVIADSTAEYHFLWYLLPMGVIFLLLTVRKIRARHSTS